MSFSLGGNFYAVTLSPEHASKAVLSRVKVNRVPVNEEVRILLDVRVRVQPDSKVVTSPAFCYLHAGLMVPLTVVEVLSVAPKPANESTAPAKVLADHSCCVSMVGHAQLNTQHDRNVKRATSAYCLGHPCLSQDICAAEVNRDSLTGIPLRQRDRLCAPVQPKHYMTGAREVYFVLPGATAEGADLETAGSYVCS